jgi:hypothetical protein
MKPSAFFHEPRHDEQREDSGTVGALAIAILFVLLAALSFAIDRSLFVSGQPAPPASAVETPR